MCSYAFLKVLFLFLSAVSVATRALPEQQQQRSSIRARAVGGYGFSHPLKKLAKAKVDIKTLVTKPEVEDIKHSLEKMGLVKLSEGTLDEKVYTGTYSIPTGKSLSNRGTILEKRADRSMEGAKCLTACGFDAGVTHPNPDDCQVVYNTLYNKAEKFSLGPRTVTYYVYQTCAGFLVNNTSGATVVYDFWDYGGSAQWLNGECIVNNQAAIGTCVFKDMFGGAFESSVYISVNHPSYFGV